MSVNRKRKDISTYSFSEDGKAGQALSFNEFNETDSTEQIALEHMLEAVEFVPDNGACMTAFEKDIIETESNPLYFLRCEDYNVWKAADRLVAYWRERLDLFGKERAFRPLFDLSGDGAMDEIDIQFLKSGVFVELTQDRDGRSVLLLTAGKLNKEQYACVDSRIRVFFFMVSWVAPRHKMNQLSGVVSMFLITGTLTKQVGRDRYPEVRQAVVRLFQEAAPVKLHRVQPIFFPDRTRENIMDMMIVNSLHIVNVLFSRYQKNLLIARKVEDIRHDFERRGLRLEDFPKSIGGSYDYKTHTDWVVELEEKSRAAAAQNTHRVEKLKESLCCVSCSQSFCSGNLISQSDKSTFYNYQNIDSPQATLIMDQSSDTDEGLMAKKDKKILLIETMAHRRYFMDEELNKLLVDEKIAFSYALEHATSLVNDESNPLVFLIHKDDDPAAAVKQLCQYWNARLHLFGERSFYRMQLYEHGALANDKIEAFKTGFIKILPVDEEGRSVLFYDSSLAKARSEEEISQSIFYALTVVMENPLSWTKGVVLLFSALNVTSSQCFGASSLSKFRNIFPIKYATIHLLLESGMHVSDLFGDNIAFCLDALAKATGGQLFVHEVQSTATFRHSIIPLPKKCLPASLGGYFTDEKFLIWVYHRQALEQELFQLYASKALLA